MKKIFGLFLTGFIAFLMIGCNVESTITGLPELELIGDTTVEVLQNSQFEDPGAKIIGDYNLDIVVDSNVDTSVLGDYTITYTITYLGKDYSISRTVSVVTETTQTTPGLNLVGEATMEVEQYSDFVDPGAEIIGDYGLDIVVDSNVDTNTLGTYTITYTITYLGVDYSLTRTVEVVEPTTEEVPSIELVGDATIEVEQDSPFVDPGAVVIGDFQLDIVVDSNVDTNTLGTYTVTYSITYNDVVYSIDRTVEVVEKNVEVVPSIELVGDATIEVEQDSPFVDPGAVVIGDFQLDIVVDSNVDTNTLGTYTVTYSITYNDIVYSIDRTVEVVAKESVFTIDLTTDVVTPSSISVNLTVTDNDGMLGGMFVKLYQETVLVDSLPYIVGTNNLVFTGLDENTTYKVVVTGDYLQNGMTMVVTGHELELTTLTAGELSVDTGLDLTVNEDSIEFGVYVVDEDSLITNMEAKLYNGDTLLQTITLNVGNNWVVFDNLNSDTVYSVEVEYSYIPYGLTEATLVQLGKVDYHTLEGVSPVILSHECNSRYYSLEGTISIDSTGFEGLYVWAELYKDGVQINSQMLSNDFTTYNFEYIDNSTDYVVKIYSDFTYSSTEENYVQVLLGTFDVSTLTPGGAIPVVENAVVTRTSTSVTVEFDLVDAENSFDNGYLRLYNNSYINNYIKIETGHNVITFDNNIDDYTLYTVKIDVDYEGNGSYTTLYEEGVYTPPVITLNSFMTNDMFYVGDHIIMKLDLNNVKDVDIIAVTINGERESTFVFPSDNNVLYIDLGSQVSAGVYTMILQNIIVTLGDEEYAVDLTQSVDVEVYEPGTVAPNDAEVKVIDIVPEEYYVNVDIDNSSLTTPMNVYVYLENKYNLTVTSITIGGVIYTGDDLTIISPTELRITPLFTVYDEVSNSHLYFSQIVFERNGELVTGTEGKQTDVEIYKIYDFDRHSETASVIHITTPEEFMAVAGDPVQPNTVYILDNDLDMSGYTFTPIGDYDNSFTGAFDGNGHTISNLTINQTFATGSETNYVGVFGYSYGYITNLTLDNININVITTYDNYLYIGILSGRQLGDVYNVSITNSTITVNGLIKGAVGGLAGEQSGNIINSSADTNIIISSTTDQTTDYVLYVGGLVGNKMYDDIRNSYASGDITITHEIGHTVYTGGLLGFIYNNGSSNPNYVMNSYATGNISVETNYYGRTGGLIGDTYMYSTSTIIINSYASGNVFSTGGKIGGLIGETYNKVIGSFATGEVSCSNGSVSRLFGKGNDYNLELIYAYAGQEVYYGSDLVNGNDYYYNNIGVASSNEFNSANYYINFLGWNTYFYNFDNLDVENNILPVAE